MSAERLDAMIESAAQSICDPAQMLDALPAQLAAQWPEAPALELAVALASAADAVQAVFGEGGESGQRAQRVWRQAAMVGADVHYLTLSGEAAQNAGDLLALWRGEDGMEGSS
ncbi:MAG: hypothetical protein ACNA7L_02435 [Roseinatronobacter sp.]